MDTTQAIKVLSSLKQAKKQKEADMTSNSFARSLNTFKNILVGLLSDLTKLILTNNFAVTVKNFPKSTTINNKELQVKVTNFPKEKEGIEKVEVVNQPNITFSTTLLEQKIDEIIKGGHTYAPLLVSSKKESSVALRKLQDLMLEVISSIKSLKLNPEIKVSTPKVEIPAPIVNIPATKFPAFPKEMKVSNLDLSELVEKLEDVLTELQYQGKQSVTVANPGDFPVSFPIPTFRDVNGAITQVTLTAAGAIPVSIATDDPLAEYHISDLDISSDPKYKGYVDEDGNWYILKETASSFRYVKGSSSYSTNWTNRASLTYDYYQNTF